MLNIFLRKVSMALLEDDWRAAELVQEMNRYIPCKIRSN